MLNHNIKLDLHIHSYASYYKEPNYKSGESYVENSTKENVQVLLDKLLYNNISLFSITDHNRYDIELYNTLNEKLTDEKYKSLHLLHGVEVDVKFDLNKSTMHIITIFDVRNCDDMKKISEEFKKNILQEKNDFYTKDRFESILKDIGLDTILIVHQRCSLDNRKGKHNSLSEAVENPYKIIQIGYINALEYQKPNVEGILKNNLRNIDSNVALITGSDCHDWNYYPKHDKEAPESKYYFSKCKILPTFKGLLLGLTSSTTRFNRNESKNKKFINSFCINGTEIELDPGINVIIGENGSGKSTLFNILCNDTSQQYIKNLKRKNLISVDNSNLHFKAIKQAELIQKFDKDELFQSEEYFDMIDTNDFENQYNTFANNLKSNIENNIRRESLLLDLENKNFVIDPRFEESTTLYIAITAEDLSEDDNPHTLHRENLAKILNMLVLEYYDNYYDSKQKNLILSSINKIKSLYDEVEKKENDVTLKNKIKNIIIAEINDYKQDIEKLSTSEDQETHEYIANKSSFVNDIVTAIKLNSSKANELNTPDILPGKSIKRYNGYVFTREMNFNDKNVVSKFLEIMFVKKYQNLDLLLQIKSKSEFQDAISGCRSYETINSIWNNNYEKFIKWSKEQKSYIKDEASDDSIGNTLGEMSLVYYKFQTSQEKEWDVLMIDQPEDNISNNRIAEKLLMYLNSVRRNKQLILVTHNPLLVVNLDVDNVIALNKVNDTISVNSGCLEDEDNEILDIVANTLDGGKDMIEKRLKIYGQNN